MSHASAAQIVRELLEGPVTRPALLRWRRKQFFATEGTGFYFGVFEDFMTARRHLPTNPEFNNEELAAEYVELRTRQVFAYDYPVMWWLEKAFRQGARSVMDIGGSVGVHYHAYRSYLDMPAGLTWQVVEVPAMVGIGRRLAAERGATPLSFTDDLGEAVGSADSDIWIAAGVLQYLEDARPKDLLTRCIKRPQHVLLNKLPLYRGGDFVTTQNIGDGCFAPVHVFNGDRLIREMEALDFTLRDRWSVHERSLYLPGYPERSFPSFTGLYFDARA
ncbi:methyltransferase, TIGR04325 family [Variovorax sp. J22P240]|uniref:methyltransferase, TIGR04325 family n=1 Tax=Variovorax sp. J22P240 TaxID=3053514 RepID=UPI0025772626|nr:methyltransferase, TIGR04325 family [Variovorax sp. J22P240]MDM0003097.1 methyltransferase, TIGR04325 family [Variovorax sp. J22P240]